MASWSSHASLIKLHRQGDTMVRFFKIPTSFRSEDSYKQVLAVTLIGISATTTQHMQACLYQRNASR